MMHTLSLTHENYWIYRYSNRDNYISLLVKKKEKDALMPS